MAAVAKPHTHLSHDPWQWIFGDPIQNDPLAPGQGAGNAVVGGIKDTAGFLQALSNPNTWVRIGEVVAGFILITVGVSAMLKVDAVKTAKKVALL